MPLAHASPVAIFCSLRLSFIKTSIQKDGTPPIRQLQISLKEILLGEGKTLFGGAVIIPPSYESTPLLVGRGSCATQIDRRAFCVSRPGDAQHTVELPSRKPALPLTSSYHHSSLWKVSPLNGHSSGVAAKPALTGFIIMYRRFSSAPSQDRIR